jgi:hypothetical protein
MTCERDQEKDQARQADLSLAMVRCGADPVDTIDGDTPLSTHKE